MKILVLNCGSSSIKFQLLNMVDESVLVSGGMDRIGQEESILSAKDSKGIKTEATLHTDNHQQGIDYILKSLSGQLGVIDNISEIDAVGHRIVHGGEAFSGSVLLNDTVIKELELCSDLAPLHNPANLQGIMAVKNILPNVPQCGIFDTAFHQTMPERAYQYALPYKYYDRYKLRRYGFHGTSHRFVSQEAFDHLGIDPSCSKIISCHLGNGASICAIKDGKSIDTSMGFTPLEGLAMGTRSGDIDAGAIFYIMKKENLDAKGIDAVLNKESGLLGLSEISSDMRDVQKAAWNDKCSRARMVLDVYAYRIKKYIGSYAAALGGADLVIFTGGIGENTPQVREAACSGLEYMGIELDDNLNQSTKGTFGIISKDNYRAKVAVIPTNEELVIARDTFALVK
jgi:acetate kinase